MLASTAERAKTQGSAAITQGEYQQWIQDAAYYNYIDHQTDGGEWSDWFLAEDQMQRRPRS